MHKGRRAKKQRSLEKDRPGESEPVSAQWEDRMSNSMIMFRSGAGVRVREDVSDPTNVPLQGIQSLCISSFLYGWASLSLLRQSPSTLQQRWPPGALCPNSTSLAILVPAKSWVYFNWLSFCSPITANQSRQKGNMILGLVRRGASGSSSPAWTHRLKIKEGCFLTGEPWNNH